MRVVFKIYASRGSNLLAMTDYSLPRVEEAALS